MDTREVGTGRKFSRFLVDGRVRTQLAVLCLMHMSDPSDSIVFVHDWGRGYYQKWTLEVYDVISRHSTSALQLSGQSQMRLSCAAAAGAVREV
jgi:hypothetical protein